MMRVALVHDWLTGMRGGEKCLEVFCELFPGADLYTLIYRPEKISAAIRQATVRTSWLDRMPAIERTYRYYLPLFPATIERLELRDYDLVLSSSHCVAKGVNPHRAIHICYLHAPMRYVWDLHDAYFGSGAGMLSRAGMALCRSYLQRWDVRSAARVDHFVANSSNIATKIKRIYGRDAAVIYPPVDLERFFIAARQEPFYLIVSALVPYKNVELAVRAFNELKLPLKIAGIGPLFSKLQRAAKPNIEFLGWVEPARLSSLYASCQAVIFPGEEDFGIVPLEAQASGRPVIAYGRGGVLESVVPPEAAGEKNPAPTGLFFYEPTPEALIQAVARFQELGHAFDPFRIRAHVARFSRDRFKTEIQSFVESRMAEGS